MNNFVNKKNSLLKLPLGDLWSKSWRVDYHRWALTGPLGGREGGVAQRWPLSSSPGLATLAEYPPGCGLAWLGPRCRMRGARRRPWNQRVRGRRPSLGGQNHPLFSANYAITGSSPVNVSKAVRNLILSSSEIITKSKYIQCVYKVQTYHRVWLIGHHDLLDLSLQIVFKYNSRPLT